MLLRVPKDLPAEADTDTDLLCFLTEELALLPSINSATTITSHDSQEYIEETHADWLQEEEDIDYLLANTEVILPTDLPSRDSIDEILRKQLNYTLYHTIRRRMDETHEFSF